MEKNMQRSRNVSQFPSLVKSVIQTAFLQSFEKVNQDLFHQINSSPD